MARRRRRKRAHQPHVRETHASMSRYCASCNPTLRRVPCKLGRGQVFCARRELHVLNLARMLSEKCGLESWSTLRAVVQWLRLIQHCQHPQLAKQSPRKLFARRSGVYAHDNVRTAQIQFGDFGSEARRIAYVLRKHSKVPRDECLIAEERASSSGERRDEGLENVSWARIHWIGRRGYQHRWHLEYFLQWQSSRVLRYKSTDFPNEHGIFCAANNRRLDSLRLRTNLRM